MYFRSLQIKNFGPFSEDEISFEKEITVLTGPNDAGKSSLLRLLKLLCVKTDASEMSEQDINSDRARLATAPWREDRDVKVRATFELRDGKSSAEAEYLLAPDAWRSSTMRLPNSSGPLRIHYGHLPSAVHIDFGSGSTIRDAIPINSPNPDERKFLGIAFGPEFNAEAFSKAGLPRRLQISEAAGQRLNLKLAEFLPPTLRFRFHLSAASDKPDFVIITVKDEHEAYTELTRRGKGIQVLINLLGHLATENQPSKETLILLDEPEAHLHADAQHSLRSALERLAIAGKFQIVYATHSSCMINTMRPSSLRLLTRVRRSDRAMTIVDNAPFVNGYASVRSTLGISPADSLLFAPLTILVEGKTEILSLPILFQRLAAQVESKFSDIGNLLGQSIFVDAEGCGNISNLCRLALSNGAKVIAFVDGDQSPRWVQQLQREYSDTPLIISKVGGEFEQIVPDERFFEALARHYNHDGAEISLPRFQNWQLTANLPDRLAFTKRISRWITEDLGARDYVKAEVMKDVAENCPLEQIDVAGLEALRTAMLHSLNTL